MPPAIQKAAEGMPFLERTVQWRRMLLSISTREKREHVAKVIVIVAEKKFANCVKLLI